MRRFILGRKGLGHPQKLLHEDRQLDSVVLGKVPASKTLAAVEALAERPKLPTEKVYGRLRNQ